MGGTNYSVSVKVANSSRVAYLQLHITEMLNGTLEYSHEICCTIPAKRLVLPKPAKVLVLPHPHPLIRDSRSNHRCDVCRKVIGTAWRCTKGCDFDVCAACGPKLY